MRASQMENDKSKTEDASQSTVRREFARESDSHKRFISLKELTDYTW